MRSRAEGAVGPRARSIEAEIGPTIRRGPVTLWASMLLVAVVAEGFIFANRSTWSSLTDAAGIGTIFVLTYGVAGTLIVSRRPDNPIGRIFLYLTVVMAVTEFCGEYAIYAYLPGHPALPLRDVLAWISQIGFFLAFPVGPTLLFLFFPAHPARPPRTCRCAILWLGSASSASSWPSRSGPPCSSYSSPTA